ncbi:hypothetical protein TraAM80_06099 [Trypanosoma rangeli]|uniref:Uncharacterized protein n=1 Tax=Trypanosoma rangeli TaxID=5698 RepID=A0A422NBT6_TRYRA|nr:uncharacterized protein TraAM80_06099 [Trypanosoma rangeli]RNF02896.1 hypothetical protein TraAM80_06099 [Trypanosoma rangeli]|eukprot:RNF02896.1 hypothetical protein TraAM80_06099 [Trypanosoma rangeli]
MCLQKLTIETCDPMGPLWIMLHLSQLPRFYCALLQLCSQRHCVGRRRVDSDKLVFLPWWPSPLHFTAGWQTYTTQLPPFPVGDCGSFLLHHSGDGVDDGCGPAGCRCHFFCLRDSPMTRMIGGSVGGYGAAPEFCTVMTWPHELLASTDAEAHRCGGACRIGRLAAGDGRPHGLRETVLECGWAQCTSNTPMFAFLGGATF